MVPDHRDLNVLRPQFSLLTALGMLSAACVAAAVVGWLGAVGIVLVSIAVALFVVAVAFRIAPEAAKYGLLTLVIGSGALAVSVLWIVQAREQARRNQAQHNLQELGQSWQLQRQSHPQAGN